MKPTRKSFAPRIEAWDRRVKEGETGPVAHELVELRLTASRIPRAEAAALAGIARRVNLAPMALKLLHRFIYPSVPGVVAADAEKIEYALSLVRVGAVAEAEGLLQSISDPGDPDAVFARVAALVSRWCYAETIPLLERYCEHPGVSPYRRLIGRVNLASALVFMRRDREASPLLAELARETKRQDLHLLHVNSLELSAQLALMAGKWAVAGRYLSSAHALLPEGAGVERLIIDKWRRIFSFRSRGPKRARSRSSRG